MMSACFNANRCRPAGCGGASVLGARAQHAAHPGAAGAHRRHLAHAGDAADRGRTGMLQIYEVLGITN